MVTEQNKIVTEEGEDGENFKEELSAFQCFLVDTEIKNGRHKVNIFQMAIKISFALGFVVHIPETGEHRYFYAHENNILIERSHLLCTKADLISIQGKVEKYDIVEQCTQEGQNTKWPFKLITNVTIFTVLLKNTTMG